MILGNLRFMIGCNTSAEKHFVPAIEEEIYSLVHHFTTSHLQVELILQADKST